jgi:hypothetical protein
MGRIKINDNKKKVTISIVLEDNIYDLLDKLHIKSKSQLINWLLKEHFNTF